MCTSYIRRHIFKLQCGQLFATREFLSYGTRTAVDKALGRLVRAGVIVRVARGLFIKDGSAVPSLLEVARAKARAFGKTIAIDAAELVRRIGLLDDAGPEVVFAVSGRSSSFICGDTVVYLKGVGPRKALLGDGKAGQAARALWHFGRAGCKAWVIAAAMMHFQRRDREEFRPLIAWMPGWFAEKFFAPRAASSPPILRRLF